jgi:membrane protease YdiL (CAAX protease family)
VGGVLVLLAVANVVSNRVLPGWAYVPWNASVAMVLLWVGWREAGPAAIGWQQWRRGVAWGAVLFVLTAMALGAAVLMPVFHDLFQDRRVQPGVPTLLYHTVVRIPLGTVLLEEMAFRAVLPALLAMRWGVLRGSIGASAAFGLWHVLPALTLNRVNPVARDVFGSGTAAVVAAVVFAVMGTFVAGLWWCWVRTQSRSMIATMIAHVATNSLGYLIAWIVGGRA